MSLRILHIASFVGNIGDNMSHIGLMSIFDDILPNYQVERLEIRKFYKNYTGNDKQHFDESFLSRLKNFDLCIIGGGGFLDYWVEGSESGTTIDISPTIISHIDVPVLICSVGCIPHRTVPRGNIDKFKRFLDACALNPLIRIILRNDGSLENVRRNIGDKYSLGLMQGLDNAFFINGKYENELPFLKDYVAVNITSDQLLMNSEVSGEIDIGLYNDELAKVVSYICEERGLNVVFVPHIYSDLEAISSLLARLDDYTIRTRISIASCLQFDQGAIAAASIYQNARLTIGMRFHANIIPIALGCTALGLVALDRVKHMYDSIGMNKNYVFADGCFSSELCGKIRNIFDDTLLDGQAWTPSLDVIKNEGRHSIVSAVRSLGIGQSSI
ncbi:polysaccharide pyruvyl transferase family protein [Marinobacter sp. DS40M6]|uniref:polysaccharide pyruvyl transferase family protein n=1 Tax=Marinobacter sp. DS40M6 TaxID=1597776 RepID=UPI002358CF64|nr:polysaccharide pyruvyl transferase family protein [Marinobacter sp. DS40M6]MDC8456140.1 polysaccharide pyruvyl transferase family protein [Marinobacter sp. DS40M6]